MTEKDPKSPKKAVESEKTAKKREIDPETLFLLYLLSGEG